LQSAVIVTDPTPDQPCVEKLEDLKTFFRDVAMTNRHIRFSRFLEKRWRMRGLASNLEVGHMPVLVC
jgi:hypothetical protein